MMDLQSTTVASCAAGDLSAGELLLGLRRRRLRGLGLEILQEKLVRQAAQAAGVTVSDADLQKATDRFRFRLGLTGSQQTRAWLESEGLTEEDLEAIVEHELLRDRLRRHLTEPRLADHFA